MLGLPQPVIAIATKAGTKTGDRYDLRIFRSLLVRCRTPHGVSDAGVFAS